MRDCIGGYTGVVRGVASIHKMQPTEAMQPRLCEVAWGCGLHRKVAKFCTLTNINLGLAYLGERHINTTQDTTASHQRVRVIAQCMKQHWNNRELNVRCTQSAIVRLRINPRENHHVMADSGLPDLSSGANANTCMGITG